MNIKNPNQNNYIRRQDDQRKYVIRISDGKNYIYDYRRDLASSGFVFNKRSGGNSFYEKKVIEEEIPAWKQFAKRFKLRIDVIPEEYMRSDDYRDTYFKNNRPVVEAKYRCAYCGKMIAYRDTTIDHIFPINKLSYNESVRRRAARWGITGANEETNLVTACRSCNSRKGTKMGLWIYRGFYGKSETFWKIRNAIRVSILVVIASAVFLWYIKSLQPNTLSAQISSLRNFFVM